MQDLASIPDKDIYHEAVSRLNAARDFCNQIGLENVGALTGSSTPPPAPAQRAARTSTKPAARSGQRQARSRNPGASMSADNLAALQAQIHDARTGNKTFRAPGLDDWKPGKTASPATMPKTWRQHFARGGRAELV